MGKSFVSIFLRTEDVHLRKDIGMIPYTMQKYYGYHSTLVTIKNGEYPSLENFLSGLELKFLRGDASKSIQMLYEFCLIKRYLQQNAALIDVLNLYHVSLGHFLLLNYYKRINKNGIAYLKLDNSNIAYGSKVRDSARFFVYRLLAKKVDIISTETKSACQTIAEQLHHEIQYIPNGSNLFECTTDDVCNKKDNIFLFCGRVGEPIKNNDVIIKAFSKIYDSCNWNLEFVGPQNNDFITWYEAFSSNYAGIKERILFHGEIDDTKTLMRYYSEAKVFLMVSKRENFSLSVAEAQSMGDFLILSDCVAPCKDFTDSGRLGAIVRAGDVEGLSKAMLDATKMSFDYEEAILYAKQNFRWEKICRKLNDLIEMKFKK